MRRTILAILTIIWFVPRAAEASINCDAVIELNAEAKMRDGVVLRADIYRPREPGKYPVILVRTSYNRALAQLQGCKTAARGYVSVIQDVRGRYGSDGAWYPFRNEADDGYDTVEWAATLPYSNGKVAMAGGSYLGITQMLAALKQPPHLVGIIPVATPNDLHDGIIYLGGAFQQLIAQTWISLLAIDSANRRFLLNWAMLNPVDAGATLPLSSYAALQASGTATAELSPFYLDWLRHPSYDDYWKSWNFDARADKYQVPAYHVGGWYDLFTRATLRNYLSMKSHAANENARSNQHLLMGPWQHGGLWRKVGDTDFGPSAEVDETDLGLRWYDYLLKGASNGLEREKPVKIFVMGKNIWREEDDWPLARARSTRYFLHSGGKANSLNGDGALSEEAAQNEPVDRYMYDPAHAVPTRGGGLCCSAHDPGGAFDQREIEARNDVLVFTSLPFKKDVEVTGPISAELWVQSSAVDTDFTAKLVDVFPDGRAQNLTDGIVRMRYRESMESPKLIVPSEIYKVTIDLAATSNVFFAGHSLRLEVSSSNFPRFDRNLNTGEDQGSSTAMVKATNTIYHDGEHRSAVILPVIPE
jgi:putative CocE/NonD family hydrolase